MVVHEFFYQQYLVDILCSVVIIIGDDQLCVLYVFVRIDYRFEEVSFLPRLVVNDITVFKSLN